MSITGNRVSRNICIVMAVAQTAVAVRYAIDYALGGATDWWQPLSAAVIAAALYRLWWTYRSRLKDSGTGLH